MQRERLRHHLANDDVQIGQHGDGNDAGHGVRGNPPEHLEAHEPRLNLVGQPVLAVHPEPEACDRDTDLSRGDVAILAHGIFEDAQHALRQPAALRGLMLDARARRADDGEFGGDEQTVGEDEEEMIAIGIRISIIGGPPEPGPRAWRRPTAGCDPATRSTSNS